MEGQKSKKAFFAHQGQGPVAAHAMAKDTDSFTVDLLEVFEDCSRQLGRDVTVHLVALLPRRLSSVDVEAGAGAKVIRVVFSLDI